MSLPDLHPQWRRLDFAALLAERVAFVNMDCQNSILSPDGCLAHEGIWRRAREKGGSLEKTLALARACRAAGMPFIWLRYDRFVGEREPATPMDAAQYRFWNEAYAGDEARKRWEAELVEEVKAVFQPEDVTLVYPAWSIFVGTPVQRWLGAWGVRTLILSGYHTDWCVEMAARSSRDLGYMPIVIGDACGSTVEMHEAAVRQINDCYAPVISAAEAIELIDRSARRLSYQQRRDQR